MGVALTKGARGGLLIDRPVGKSPAGLDSLGKGKPLPLFTSLAEGNLECWYHGEGPVVVLGDQYTRAPHELCLKLCDFDRSAEVAVKGVRIVGVNRQR